MGTPAFAGEALRGVIESRHDIVMVVSQPDRPVGRGRKVRSPEVARIAKQNNLPLVQPESVGKKEFREVLQATRPDVAVVAAFGQIFGPKLLALPRLGCINVHASSLPRWRGAAPIQSAILEGDGTSGVTIMQMSLGLDEGAILLHEEIELDAMETGASLHDKLARIGRGMIGQALDRMEDGSLVAREQPHLGVTYCPKLSKEDGHLNFEHPAVALERRVRALHPWPGTFTFLNDERLKIFPPVTVHSVTPYGRRPGEVVRVGSDSFAVATSDGELEVFKVQRAGRPAVDVKSFLAGYRLTPGMRVGGPC